MDFCEKLREAMYWRAMLPMKRLIRPLSSQAKTVSVRGHKIKLKVGTDIEQYRVDTYESKEIETLDWIDQHCRDGTVFFDVGANIGLYSLYAAARAPESLIFAFEPESQNFARLCANIHLNQLVNVRPCNLAFSDASRLEEFHVSSLESGSSMHSLGAPTEMRHGGAESVLRQLAISMSLDEVIAKWGLPGPNMLKIDVDGIEEKIIEGATSALGSETLKHVLIELSGSPEANSQAGRIVGYLKSKGFQVSHEGRALMGGNGELVRNYLFEK